MKKMMMMAAVMAAAGAFAGGGWLVDFSAGVTNGIVSTQEVSAVRLGAANGRWSELEGVRVLVPAGETGSVSIAAQVMGVYTNLLSIACTNASAAAEVVGADAGGAALCGPLRVLFTQSGDTLHEWGCVLLVR